MFSTLITYSPPTFNKYSAKHFFSSYIQFTRQLPKGIQSSLIPPLLSLSFTLSHVMQLVQCSVQSEYEIRHCLGTRYTSTLNVTQSSLNCVTSNNN